MKATKKLLLAVSATMVVALAIPSIAGAEEPAKPTRHMQGRSLGASLGSESDKGTMSLIPNDPLFLKDVDSADMVGVTRLTDLGEFTLRPTTRLTDVMMDYGFKPAGPKGNSFLMDVDSEDMVGVNSTHSETGVQFPKGTGQNIRTEMLNNVTQKGREDSKRPIIPVSKHASGPACDGADKQPAY